MLESKSKYLSSFERVLLKPPAPWRLNSYPPTYRPLTQQLTYLNIEDQILNMFCILKLFKTLIMIYFLENFYLFPIIQFVIFNPWKVPWNWIAFYQNSFVISPGSLYHWLDATLDDLQTRPFHRILLFLRKNSLSV